MANFHYRVLKPDGSKAGNFNSAGEAEEAILQMCLEDYMHEYRCSREHAGESVADSMGIRKTVFINGYSMELKEEVDNG